MLDFRTPTLDDKERIESFVRYSGRIGCDTTFVNTYLWRRRYDIRVAFTDDTYYKAYFTDGVLSGYSFPATKGDYRAAVDTVIADARERGVQPLIGLLTDRQTATLRILYGDRVSFEPERGAFDYLYRRADLVALRGKKYHAKRNHISQFNRAYGHYTVEEINEINRGDALAVAERWQENEVLTGELDAIREALEHFDRLGLFGIILYVDDEPIAMSIGSRITDEVCDVNFEKALDYEGAYAVINQEFAKHYSSFTYLNREEDLGIEGLRKSKLSYHPCLLIRKSIATFTLE